MHMWGVTIHTCTITFIFACDFYKVHVVHARVRLYIPQSFQPVGEASEFDGSEILNAH